MKITDVTTQVLGEMKAVEAGVHEAVEEFNASYPSNGHEENSTQSGNRGFITIPSATAHKLFKMGVSGIDALTLYNFLQYTAIWQNDKHGTNNRPKATREYCKKGLHWGTKRYVEASRVLREMGLKRSRLHKVKGEIKGRYTELPFINLEKTSTEDVSRKDLRAKRPQLATNTDSKDILNTNVKNILGQKEKKPEINKPIKLDTSTNPNKNTGMTGLEMPPAMSKKSTQYQTYSNLSDKKYSVNIPSVEEFDGYSALNPDEWKAYEQAMSLSEEEAEKISVELGEGVNGKGGFKVSPEIVLERQASQFDYIQNDILDGKKIPTKKHQFIARYKNFLRRGQSMGANVSSKQNGIVRMII